MMWKFEAKLELWPTTEAPWHYLEIPENIVEEIQQSPLNRGLKKVTAKINDYEWQTSIMPAGKGRKILPIKAEVRKDLDLTLGNSIEITIAPLEL